MKAVVTRHQSKHHAGYLEDVKLSKPVAGDYDLLVRVEAISVNPVDTKVASSETSKNNIGRVLGWDASGTVEEVGSMVTRFKPGDEVFYAGDIRRPGSNSEFQLVDERITGFKPAISSFDEAAALPLTSLTAWEALFDRINIDPNGADRNQYILIIGGAGGVGSIAIQLAKHAGLTVITTASRPETKKWVTDLGADHVIDHHKPLKPQLELFDIREVDFIANFHNTDSYWKQMSEIIRPQGKIVCIVENEKSIDLNLLKSKSVLFVWESMFTRSAFQTSDMDSQGKILDEIAGLIDKKILRTTLFEKLAPINADNIQKAHEKIKSSKTIGKIVLTGW
jgi:NADPH2:quinone reductase